MSEFSIGEILDAFYLKQHKTLALSEEFSELEEIEEALRSIFGEMEQSAVTDKIENTDIGAERFLGYLIQEGVLQSKGIPFSEPVYRFIPTRYGNVRSQSLKANRVFQDAQGYPNYWRRVFDGYLQREQDDVSTPPVGEVISHSELAQVNWKNVSQVHDANSIKQIRAKAVELSSAIQQSDLSDRHKSNLLSKVRAVSELLDAPDPDWEIIVKILNNKYLAAFLNAVALTSLILGS